MLFRPFMDPYSTTLFCLTIFLSMLWYTSRRWSFASTVCWWRSHQLVPEGESHDPWSPGGFLCGRDAPQTWLHLHRRRQLGARPGLQLHRQRQLRRRRTQQDEHHPGAGRRDLGDLNRRAGRAGAWSVKEGALWLRLYRLRPASDGWAVGLPRKIALSARSPADCVDQCVDLQPPLRVSSGKPSSVANARNLAPPEQGWAPVQPAKEPECSEQADTNLQVRVGLSLFIFSLGKIFNYGIMASYAYTQLVEVALRHQKVWY